MIAVHVVGPATTLAGRGCFLRLVSRVAGGGTAVYCLQGFRGSPGPNAVVRVRGTITFRLPQRTIRAAVLIVDRFAADGRHAHQSVSGGVSGGGTFVEDPPGHVRASDLRYRVP